MEKLLTVTEVAAYLRTTTTTIYRWLKQGRLSAVKIGKEWRISEEQFKNRHEQRQQDIQFSVG